MKGLVTHKAFLALLGAQFLGAFIDNFFRAAFVTLTTYHLEDYSETTKSLFVAAAFGLFMLPFFIFSPIAGQLADRYDKASIIRYVKGFEILIVSLSAYGFIHKLPFLLLGGLFCMAIPSSFFGPAKYGLLPEILPQEMLLKGNGYIEAGSFLAVMLGTLCGGLMIQWEIPLSLLSLQLIFLAFIGFFISLFLPSLPSRAPHLKMRLSWIVEMEHLTRYVSNDARVFKSLLSMAWFWLIQTVLLTQLPDFVKETLNVEKEVFIFLLLLFTFGNGIGSILCGWLFKGKITTRYIPLLSLMMVPLLFDIAEFKNSLTPTPLSLGSFLNTFQGLRLTFDFLCLFFIGGMYIVLLYTFVQAHISPEHRSQVMAFSNILNAAFIVLASFGSFSLLSLDSSVSTLLLLVAIGQTLITIYVTRILIKK